MLGQLQLAPVLVDAGFLQSTQVILKLLPGQQALPQAVPVTEADVVRLRQTELETQAALRLLGEIVGQLVAVEIDTRDLPDLPLIKSPIGWRETSAASGSRPPMRSR
jgi:hypothetical protein